MINHIAIIPDGNRRWAKERGLLASLGHNISGDYNHILNLCKETKSLGIKYLSLWAFSTENWQRDQQEIDILFDVIKRALDCFIGDVVENKFHFKHLGRKERIPNEITDKIEILERLTKNYLDFNFIVGIDYGGKDEIIRAVNRALKLNKENISESEFSLLLDSREIPDPDLIIRTGGEKRLSGFMPFKSVYSELYFTNMYFPDFEGRHLKQAIEEYKARQRRFGR